MVLVHRANVTREAENGSSAEFFFHYPCKIEPTARQSSYFVRSAFVGLCHGEKIIPIANFNVNNYIEKKISQIKKTNLK